MLIDRQVVHRPEEPGCEGRRSASRRQVNEPRERLLDRVLRVGGLTPEPPTVLP